MVRLVGRGGSGDGLVVACGLGPKHQIDINVFRMIVCILITNLSRELRPKKVHANHSCERKSVPRRNLLAKWSELLYSDRTPSFRLKRSGNKVKDSQLS